jgi:membrane fusion protein, copper/silver efflux system
MTFKTKYTKKHVFIYPISVFALSLALLGLGSGCNQATEQQPVMKVNATTLKVDRDALENIKVARATLTDFPDQLSVMGRISITEDRTNIVPARVSGRIEQIFFASGESVREGQILATLFSPDYIAAREEYLQSLRQSKMVDQKADPSDFANLTQMAKKKLQSMGLNAQDINALSSQAASSSTIERDESKPPLLNIRAPHNGALIAKGAVLGNLVNVGDTLFMIGDLSKVWFLGDLYPEDLPKVHKGQEVRVIVPNEKNILKGTISFVSPIIDPNSRTIKVRALIDNPGGILRGDMFVQGNLILNNRQALVIPTDSIIRTAEGEAVFKRTSAQSLEKATENVQFQKVIVKLGPERQGMSAIAAGLQDGDEVVSDGALLLDEALNTAEQNK